MAQTLVALNEWLERVNKAESGDQVFALLAEFRKIDWSDDDRSRMAKLYMKVLDRVAPPSPAAAAVEEETGPDGPVWYEKM